MIILLKLNHAKDLANPKLSGEPRCTTHLSLQVSTFSVLKGVCVKTEGFVALCLFSYLNCQDYSSEVCDSQGRPTSRSGEVACGSQASSKLWQSHSRYFHAMFELDRN